MTWNEFKTLIDKELERQGKNGDEGILFIDTGSFPDADYVEVSVGEDGITIT